MAILNLLSKVWEYLTFLKSKITVTIRKLQNREKAKRKDFLKSLNIPFIAHLPLIEEESEAKIRTAQEIAERILILTYLNYVSEVPDEKEKVIDFLKSTLLWEKVSPNEKEIFQKEALRVTKKP